MSVTDGIGQTPCSLEHYLVYYYEYINHDKRVIEQLKK